MDEDSWTALAADQYDARGQLFRGGFAPVSFAYDALAVPTATQNFHDLIGDRYVLAGNVGLFYGIRFKDGYPARDWIAGRAGGGRHSLSLGEVPGATSSGHRCRIYEAVAFVGSGGTLSGVMQ